MLAVCSAGTVPLRDGSRSGPVAGLLIGTWRCVDVAVSGEGVHPGFDVFVQVLSPPVKVQSTLRLRSFGSRVDRLGSDVQALSLP
jgi:hypothetical protein